MTLFIHCYSKGHEPLQVTAIQTLCDMLTSHPSLLAPVTQADKETVAPPAFQKPLLKVFARALKPSSPSGVQTAAAAALSKLMLTNVFTPSAPNIPQVIQEFNQNAIETLLQSLVVSFFHPRTRDNPALRQSLAYFFPVYCHSRPENTQHMRKITVPVIRTVLNSAEEYYSLEAEEDSDGEIDESVGDKELKALMTGVIGMLSEWTDERRVVGLGGERVLAGGPASSNACGFIHLELIKDILERVLGVSSSTNRCSKEERKLLFSLMSKLYIAPPTAPSRSASQNPENDDSFRTSVRSSQGEINPENLALAQEVKELLDQTIEEGMAADAAGRNALVKVKNVVLKLLAAPMRPASARGRESSVDSDSDMVSVKSRSARASVEPGLSRRGVSVEPSIMEEDENNEDSRMTVIKEEEPTEMEE